MKFIPITKGQFAIVDDEDYEWLNQWRWHASKQKGIDKWRAARTVFPNGKYGVRVTILMHRQITGAQHGQLVDHWDGNPLNNQRSNLRLCNHQQNTTNRGKNSGNTSGYKGVYLLNKGRPKPWHARVGSKKEHGIVHGGYFATPEEAARKYDELAKQIYGEFAQLNFPEQQT